MSALLKSEVQKIEHSARPAARRPDMKAAYARIAKRYPKILAKLAE